MISIKSPTRVDLAGGTLDLWPLHLFIGGARTINVSIDIFTGATIEALAGTKIILKSRDLNLTKEYSDLRECLEDSDNRLNLLRSQIQFWKPSVGFKLETFSDSPVGGGLGGSSSLTISLMRAFGELCQRSFDEKTDLHDMVRVAHNIEAEVLNTPTGTQDYYPAVINGVGVLDYSYSGVQHRRVPVDPKQLTERFLLVYTGKSHHSGINNFQVLTNAVNKDPQTLGALKKIKEISDATISCIEKQKWQDLPSLFNREFDARIELCDSFSSPEIQKLKQVSLSAGAQAVKICGAGGGGCVLVWVDPDQREKVMSKCQLEGFQVLNAKPYLG